MLNIETNGENSRTSLGLYDFFKVTFSAAFNDKTTILEVVAPLCAGLAQGLERGVQKNHFGAKPLALLGYRFRVFRYFLTCDFSFIFEVTSDPEL